MRLVDTHCHLNLIEDFPRPAEAVKRAVENHVDKLIVVGFDTASSQRAVQLADEFPEVYACVGWHPTQAADFSKPDVAEIEQLAAHPKAVAIGEIGLDYHWKTSTREQQRACTAAHLWLAHRLRMPVVFHCRDAYPDLLSWLERLEDRPPEMVLHCFSGTAEEGRRALDMGCHLGVDGPVTYQSAKALRSFLATAPLGRLLLETDAPYLTPHPYRGKPNEPAMLPLVNSALAQALELTPEDTASATTANAERVFGLR